MARSKVSPKYKGKYRIENWPSYDQSLRRRGEFTLWFTPALLDAWKGVPTGRRGGQPKFSDAVIELALTLRLLFRLPWRQTEGFLDSLLRLVGIDLDVPDHTTLSRRTRGLNVQLRSTSAGHSVILVLDATGLGIVGEGEWAAAKWGQRGRRGWKKLHIAVDEQGQICAAELTESTTTDGSMAPALLEQVEQDVTEVIADGAYDQRQVHQAIHDKGARSVIPPSRTAKISGQAAHRSRDAHLERIEEVGRRQWRQESGQTRQSRAENTFFRFKQTFGGRIRARHPGAQQAEVLACCNLLNRFTSLGMPKSVRVAT
ncbi:MAG: IS5 family transposase [Myxococcota bacterium]